MGLNIWMHRQGQDVNEPDLINVVDLAAGY